MDNITAEEKAILQVHEERLKNFRQSNQAMIDFSKMALRGTFILNGAAAAAILGAKIESLYQAAYYFGMGALSSILAVCMSFLAQWATSRAWKVYFEEYPFKDGFEGKKSYNKNKHDHFLYARVYHVFAMFLVLISVFQFAVGLSIAHN